MLNNALIAQQGSRVVTPPFTPLAGQLQLAVQNGGSVILRSVNYGVTWTNTPAGSGLTYRGIACSGTGMYVIAVGANYINVSTNYGVSYTNNNIAKTFQSAACSSSGQYQYATVTNTNEFYRSTNYGVSWSSLTTYTGANTTMKCNATGQYVILCKENNDTYLYLSTDYGASFSAITTLPTGNFYALGCTLSSTGQYQYASIYNWGIYGSSDYGANWSVLLADPYPTNIYQFNTIACSGTGQYVMAGNYTGNIFQSADYGSTFVEKASTTGNHYDSQMTYNGVYRLSSGGSLKLINSADSGSTYTNRTIAQSSIEAVALNTINA